MLDKKIVKDALNSFYFLLNITCSNDMDNIRELFKKAEENEKWGKIIKDSGKTIEVKYENIGVVFEGVMGCGYDEYGGKAIAQDVIKIYNDDECIGSINICEEILA